MSRAKSTDFLHNFRFHVVVLGYGINETTAQVGTLGSEGTVSAGFNACSAPEVSHDAVEYREGHYVYTRKFVGLPTVADITLSRGVALTEGALWTWMKDVVDAGNEYRAKVNIYHIHRDMKGVTTTTDAAGDMKIVTDGNAGYRVYHCLECFPLRYKASSDLDATASEVSVQELDLAMEQFTIENVTHPATPAP